MFKTFYRIKIENNFKQQTMLGLSSTLPEKRFPEWDGTTCHQKNICNINKGPTRDTSTLQPCEQLHIDFTFFSETSIRNFTESITDAAILFWWPYPSKSKAASLKIIEYF